MATLLLTRDEVAEVLKNICNQQKEKVVQLRDYTIESVTDAMGYLGDYYRLYINYEQTLNQGNESYDANAAVQDCAELLKETAFIKTIKSDNAELHKCEIFKKESNLYDTLLRKLQQLSNTKWSAKCFYARTDLLVLEDLNKRNYELTQNRTGNLCVTEMKQLLRSLAALHAASIVYETQNQCNLLDDFKELSMEITISTEIAWFTQGLSAITAIAKEHPDMQSIQMQKFVEHQLSAALNDICVMMNPSTKYRNVFCHRDIWLGNIFFKSDLDVCDMEPHAVLVDYQTARYCPACIDVIFALYLNLEHEEQQRHELEYLTFYYEQFQWKLKQFKICAQNELSFAEFLQSYREYELCGVVYKALAATVIGVPRNKVTNIYKFEKRATMILQFMRDNLDFQLYMRNCVANIVNMAVKRIK